MLQKALDWFVMGLCFGLGFCLSSGVCDLIISTVHHSNTAH